MTAEKAKEIIDLNIKEAGKTMPPDVKTALIIHSEAMERLIYARIVPDQYYTRLLPSETIT
ncbi:unnamed protein product [marine sediment metagenome]|uniref:Uncharacterized protein n=1 Tax=marine sediment metagenome TaxID=412755 RepID=X1UPG2_9ZZZZ